VPNTEFMDRRLTQAPLHNGGFFESGKQEMRKQAVGKSSWTRGRDHQHASRARSPGHNF